MIRRSAIVAAEVAGFLLAGLAVLVALAAWRLSTGPIQVDALTPYLEDALSQGPLRLSLGGTSIRWDGFDQPIELVATNVAIQGEGTAPVARIPALSVSFGARGMLRGRLVPRRIELVEPRVRIERAEDGAIRLGLGEDASPGSGSQALEALLEALRGEPGARSGPLAALETVSVSGGRIVVVDRVLDVRWQAPRADIELQRVEGGVEGSARLDVQVDDRIARLDADIDYRTDRDEATAELRLENVVPADLAAIDPVLGPLAVIASPVRGTVSARFGAGFTPRDAGFELEAGAGVLRLDGLYAEPLRVAALHAAGNVDLSKGVLSIDRFVADLGGPRIEATAVVTDRSGTLDITGRAAVVMLPTDLLASYWPERLARNARAWVTEHVSRGVVRRAEARLRARAPAGDLGAIRITSLGGDLGFDGVTLQYLREMPPVTGIAGTATFDRRTFTLDIAAGRSHDLAVTEADVAITGLEGSDEAIDIEVVLAGPMAAALAVLDRPPLGYPSEIGIAPADAAGTMSARLRFAFPLKRDLEFADVALAAAANLRDVRLGAVVGDVAVGNLDGKLILDGHGLTLTGTAELNGVPATVAWDENFGAGGAFRRRVRLGGTLDDAGRAALDLPAYEGLSGPIPVDAVYTDVDGAGASLTAALDLEQARLDIDLLGWEKAPGVPGRAELSLALDGEELRRLSSFVVETAGLTARGDAVFARGTTEIATVALAELVQGRNRFGLEATRLPDGGFSVALRGQSLDASGIFDTLLGDTDAAAEPEPEGTARSPLQLTIQMDQVFVGGDRAIFGANGALVRGAGGWQTIDIDARTDTGAPIQLRYGPGGDGVVRLSLIAQDAGAALRTFDLVETVRGGRLAIEGRRVRVGDAGVAAPDTAFVGNVRLDDFRVVRAPALARLLAALSLGGLNDLLTSDGITFNRLVADYRLDDGVLTIADARTSGGALGLTLDGTVDLDSDRVDASGTIVPLSGINQVIGAIPIIGDILTGGEGQGVFAFTYGIEGPLAEPTVTVNPLAVLAPGFLRNLFFLDGAG